MLAAWLVLTLAAVMASALVLREASTAAEQAAWRRAAIGAAGAEQSVARLFDAVRALHEVAAARARFITTGDVDGAALAEDSITRIDGAARAILELAVLSADGVLAYSSVPVPRCPGGSPPASPTAASSGRMRSKAPSAST